MDNNILDEINEIIGEKDFAQAKIRLEDLLKEDEFNVEALKMLGLCNLNLELYEQGRINFETVVKYAPDDATSWFYLASCYDNLEDYESRYLLIISKSSLSQILIESVLM